MPKHVAMYGVDLYGDPDAVYGAVAGPVKENAMQTNSNRISASLDGAPITAINTSIDTLETTLSFQLNLTQEEKKTMAKAAEKTAGFLEKCISYMTSNPEFIPGFVDMAEVNKDIALRSHYLQFLLRLRTLISKGEDTLTIINSEIYRACLAYYEAVERAASMGAPGAQAIYNDLKEQFPGRGAAQPKPPTS